MRKLGARVLLASVLAIGAQLAGCGDDPADCPPNVVDRGPCATAGMSCFQGSELCTCKSLVWQCGPTPRDLSVPDLATRDMRRIELE